MSTATRTLEVPGYEVVQYLGSGARSTIWQVRELQTGRFCALKRVLKRDASDARYVEQVVNEYAIAHKLSHPVLRSVYKLNRIRRWVAVRELHLFMEFCDGIPLHESRPRTVIEAVNIFLQVAEGLEHMSATGFVHADMKPNNILVAPNGSVKIIDLGQSCAVGTIKERIQGTPDYIAPEQVARQPLDQRTDVFNLGASMYWTLTGRPMPTAMPKNGAATMKHEHQLIPPSKLNAQVPPALNKLVVDCAEFLPSRRPATMKDVRARLSLVQHTLMKNANSKDDTSLKLQDPLADTAILNPPRES